MQQPISCLNVVFHELFHAVFVFLVLRTGDFTQKKMVRLRQCAAQSCRGER